MSHLIPVLSGMRPTGKLHLGNYWGALVPWIQIQNGGLHRCFFMVADLHALTTGYEDTSGIAASTEDMVLDWLAAGLDPEKSVIFVQSRVTEHSELALLLSMITPLGWLERIPTYKEQLREITGREITTHGFLGYPVLQAADILLYKAQAVPVGEDQLSHLELTQEIARRFNR
ncbi:MAG: tryptophan--tRNA ligase, partial [Elusimicrobia bacterium]|nr:tryptophan--tRNA ligase [Elusimicrobiota bacterium]